MYITTHRADALQIIYHFVFMLCYVTLCPHFTIVNGEDIPDSVDFLMKVLMLYNKDGSSQRYMSPLKGNWR